MKHFYIGIFFLLSLWNTAFSSENSEETITAEQEKYFKAIATLVESLDKQQGEIHLSNNVAKLTVPDNYFYLNTEDSKKILVDLWGNPPAIGTNLLGMILPSNRSPLDSTAWGVTIKYEEDGYVPDDDANDIDYDDLLEQMQEDIQASNKERIKQGYEAIHLIGWASTPFYDKQSHKLHWAKELKFGTLEQNTLNYNIRILGRKGVLVLNFIADMSQKEEISTSLDEVLAIAEFNPGLKYSDFNPDIDKVAAYGIGGLIAGKVLLKSGFLAAAILFLKKFGIFIVIGIGGIARKLFSGKQKDA